MEPARQRLLDAREQLVHADAAARAHGDVLLADGEIRDIADEVGLVIAAQPRGTAGLGQLFDQPVNNLDVCLTVRVGRIDDMQQQVRILQLLQRGPERPR